jgi:cell division protein FtsW (lipid II flippase)
MYDDENEDFMHSEKKKPWPAILAVLFFWIGFLILMFSCKPIQALHPTGTPIKSQHNMIEVLFPTVKNPNQYAAQWFYFPGLGLISPSEYRVIISLEKIK